MAQSIRQPGLLRTRSQWVAVAVCALLGFVLFAFVDLAPEVETNFFFSTTDPQLQGGRTIEQEFGSAPQIFIAARSERLFSSGHLNRIGRLTDDLRRLDGVLDVRSLTRGPEDLENIGESPFWSRLLLAPDRSASLIVLRLTDKEQGRLVPAIDLFSWETKLEQLEKPELGRIGRTFISEDRRRARFILRMDETSRSRPREDVIGEIRGIVRAQGFRTVAVGGLYPLQGELSRLVEGSVIRGLGGLLAAFALIVLIVTRSIRTALAMTVCLAITPLTVFGIVGLAHMPLDIIAAPAANVALPLGIDEMLHLGHRARHVRHREHDGWQPWAQALADMWRPILASMLIVASGFALFLLSDFPPTQRLGALVCIGAIVTDLVVLVALPAFAMFGRRRR